MMIGIWQYPLNPSRDIPGFNDKHQFRMTGQEIRRFSDRELMRYTADRVNVPEHIAFSLAKMSPNPQKAEHAVHLLASQQNLKLLPLAALLFASARR
jgi:hypothetical protein